MTGDDHPGGGGGPGPLPFRPYDPGQARLIDKLGRLVGPGAAAFYRDACRLLALDPPLEATTHVVAHLLREIESALRDVLEPIGGAPAKDHAAEIVQVLRALEIPDTDALAQAWLALAGRGEGALHKRAHRDALKVPRPTGREFRQWWADMEGVLDAVLARVETRFIRYKQKLDQLLSKAEPAPADLNLLTGHIPNSPVFHAYFFDRLSHVGWLTLLAQAAFFASPPPAIPEENGIRYPPWPVARYLRRMAHLEPAEVMRIVAAIPTTDNMSVHMDLVETVLTEEVPPALAAAWAGTEADWLAGQDWLYPGLAMKLGTLISRLARSGEAAAALQLGRALLATKPGTAEPQSKCNGWEYEQVLSKALPELTDSEGAAAFGFACDLLGEALAASTILGNPPSPPHANSESWRAAIEDHEQNLRLGLRSVLVSAVRDAAAMLAAKAPERAPEVVRILQERGQGWFIFHRVALHILRLFYDHDQALATAALTDRNLFDAVEVRHEYVLLLKERFGKLQPADQERILGWIREGPQTEGLKERLSAFSGREVTDDEVAECCRQWQRVRLEPIANSLPAEWRSIYEGLLNDTRAPEHPEFPVFITGGAFGPSSPKSADELAAMSLPDLACYLEEWQPSSNDPFHGPTPAGLARELTSAVARDPARYAPDLELFRLGEPTYVRGVLYGFHGALLQNKAFDWGGVLNLCAWAAAQTGEGTGQRPTLGLLDRDADWTDTRRTVLILVGAGLKSETCPIPFALSASVLAALRPLTDDPSPTPDEESEVLIADREPGQGRKTDPLTYAINTVRGKAIEDVIGYALWVRKNLENHPEAEALKIQGFKAMPGVAEILDRHLDPTVDPSLAVRAIYGCEFPRLHYLDARWAGSAVPRIFPSNPNLREHRAAAWGAYLASWHATDQMWRALHHVYREAVDSIGASQSGLSQLTGLDVALARHLLTFYWRGQLDEEPSLLGTFYAKAHGPLRAEAMNFIGWSLKGTEGAVPIEVLDRLRKLWEGRLHAASQERSPGDAFREELAQFGWWFGSGKFEDAWAMDQLLPTLRIAKNAQPDHLVVERLAQVSGQMPGKAIECLALMIAGDDTGWKILGWREGATKIIGDALKASDARAIEDARALANRLASLGHHEFLRLLSPGQ